MSYARMEGFLSDLTAPDFDELAPPESWDHCLKQRLTERWIASVFFGTLLFILLVGFLRS